MSTFLFDEIIFGPVSSRRFGISLGINLLPCKRKICSFNCIYCECGWTKTSTDEIIGLPDRQQVKNLLGLKLSEMKSAGNLPDTITFAGNGEPTLHPQFKGIIEDTVALRNQLAPGAKVTVLSNATMVHLNDVFDALKLADNNVLKLDAGTEEMYRLINRGPQKLQLEQIVENLMKFAGKLTVQTLFLKGTVDGMLINNTTESEVHAWLGHLQRIKPELLMIYPIARATPASGLEKIEKKILQKIAYQTEGLGIKTEVF